MALRQILLITILIFFFTSCETGIKNLPEHINEGKAIAQKYFDGVKQNDETKKFSCYDMNGKDINDIRKNTFKLDSIFGKFDHAEYKIGSSIKKSKFGETIQYSIHLVYKVYYEKKIAKETMDIELVTDTLKIINHNVTLEI